MKRPNILLLYTDQQRWDALACAGNPHIHTPNLDRLAAEGMLLFAGQTIRYTGDVRTIKFIEVTAGAELNVSLYY